MPFRKFVFNLGIRRNDRKSKNLGVVNDNDQIDSTSASSSPSRPHTTTKNSSTESSNIPTSATNTVDSSKPAAKTTSFVHQNTNLQPTSNSPTSSQVPTSNQDVEAKKPLSHDIPRRIWDEAYSNLKKSEPKLVDAYEVVLSHEPEEAGSSSEGSLLKDNIIEKADDDKRWSWMDKIVQNGLKDTEKESKIRQVIGKALGGVLQLNTLISTALQATPQAALAWAGVTFAMQIFVNPASESKSNRDGIIYVISMMQWYGELSVLLLKEDIINAEESAGVRGQLRGRVIRLYEALLLYLIRSVYAFNRNRLVAFLRDAIMLDDWKGSLVDVKGAEDAVRTGSEAYNTQQIRRNLEEILEVARNQQSKLLQDIHSVLQDQISVQQQQVSVQLKKEDQECIQNLHTTNPRHDKKRIEDTKGGLLSDSYCWVFQNQSFKDWRNDQQTTCRLLWIKGNPGKGKTMLICGIINELEKSLIKTKSLSYFFCQATDQRINNATSVLRGLLYMLLDQQPSLTSHVRERYDNEQKALFNDVNAFFALSEIFTDILQDPSLKRAYLIIDALDECVYDLPKLLGFIRQMTSSPHVKWIVSSRNWPKIEEVLKKTGHKIDLSLELNDEDIYAAVETYIKHKVSELADDKDYDEETQVEVENYLSSNANGTYLWVALVCQNLKTIESWHTLNKLKEFPPGLDSLYDQMLKTIKDLNDADLCMRILASNAVVYRPVTLEELVSVVNMPKAVSKKPKLLGSIIGLCGSFLTIREGTIYFVHQSAKDYLVTDAFDRIFPSGAEPVHQEIFSRSLQVMSTLKRDIYKLHAPGYPIEQVKPPDSDPLQASRYSCIYWTRHLCDSISRTDATQSADLQDGGKLDNFIRNKFLYWLEALSLCRSMSEGLFSMVELDTLIHGRAGQIGLKDLVHDARRFIMYHKRVIENCPLQAYTSALLFSPVHSLIRGLFMEEEPKWIKLKPAMADKWSACLQTLVGHDGYVNSVAFSHDSARLASGSEDKTVKIWNASSGECLLTLEGHGNNVKSVAFSHNSTRLASGSYDSTVKIWNTSSGECLQTLKAQRDWVNSVAFSHDSAWLASSSLLWNSKVKIWDANSGNCLKTLEGHGNGDISIAFSHDSAWLASGSVDGTVKIWDTSSGNCLQTLEGHSDEVWSVAFSHDSARLASGSEDGTVKIWDTSIGECQQTLGGHRDSVRSVVFSHDSARLASASWDKTVKIWDTSSGDCLQTLDGRSDKINSVAFSHDSALLASALWDETVKIWDTSSGDCLQTLAGHSGSVESVAFSHDSARLASASNDGMVGIWDTSSGKCLQTLEIGRTLDSISFDTTGSYLYTEMGAIAIDASSASSMTPSATDPPKPRKPRYQGYGLSLNGAWITYNSENILWLPSEYRPSCLAVSGETIAIGVGSGKVWIYNFKANDSSLDY